LAAPHSIEIDVPVGHNAIDECLALVLVAAAAAAVLLLLLQTAAAAAAQGGFSLPKDPGRTTWQWYCRPATPSAQFSHISRRHNDAKN